MNDFPIPEDPPVMITAEKVLSISSEGDMSVKGVSIFEPAPIAGLVKTNKIRSHMNRQNPHELIVSGIHLDLTPSLKTFVRDKVERLFRHEERILRLRVELECDPKEQVATRFKAKGHIVIQGPAMNATVEADECHKAVSLLTDKLDRMLSRRQQLSRTKRHRERYVDADVAFSAEL